MRLFKKLLGVPARSDDYLKAVGRTQTRSGRWWDQHPVLLRVLAVLTLGWVGVYLAWRIGWSLSGSNLWLAVPLLLTEVYGLWNIAMLTWFSWSVRPATRPPLGRQRAVDVYVCTYDEPASVLRATLTGCAALNYPHTTYLLDDGRRPEMAALAAELGAEYLTRSDNSHAKAGNINSALLATKGDLVLVLDADHVPLPDALDALVGYFEDDKVAMVQTPHDFYNHDSVQHYQIGRHEQSVFFSVIMPGKDRHGAAFWCGSGAVIRRDALLGVGGVATETIAEDFHTTIKLHGDGWTTRYHNEVLIQGLAPHDLGGYLLQRDRWARGNLAVFATPESPLRARKLSLIQRLSYFASLSSYLSGPIRLLSLATLVVVLWTGMLPLIATPLTLGLLWAPAMLLSITCGGALCRGFQNSAEATHFELSTAEVYGRALRCAIRPGSTRFKVTPKSGVDLGGWEAVGRLRILCALVLVMAAGLIVRLLDDTGIAFGFLPQLHGIALWVVPLITVAELRRVLRTLVIVGARHQLRADYRVPLDAQLALTVSGAEPMIGHSRDITPGGMSIEVPERVEIGASAHVLLTLPSLDEEQGRVPLDVEVVSCRQGDNGWVVGARITDAGSSARHRLLEYCFVIAPTRRLRGAEHELPAQTSTLALPAPSAARAS